MRISRTGREQHLCASDPNAPALSLKGITVKGSDAAACRWTLTIPFCKLAEVKGNPMNQDPVLAILKVILTLVVWAIIWWGVRKAWDAGWIQSLFSSAIKIVLVIAAILFVGFVASSLGGDGDSSCAALTARYC